MRHPIDMLEAKAHLPELVDSLEHGQTAAQLAARRIGIAKGRFEAPSDIDASNELIQQLFAGH